MKEKFKMILVSCLLIGGCGTSDVEIDKKEEIVEEVETEEKVEDLENEVEIEEDVETEEKEEDLENEKVYTNIEDGLLSNDNRFSLNAYYMLLDESNKKVGSTMTPTYIVIHNTANSAPAINEVKYLNSSSNTSSTSFHFAVDDTSVYQAINLKYNAWHAGDISMNKKSIGIEVAKSTITDTEVKDKAIENAAKLTAVLMEYYDIPLSRVITHQDVTGKNCPHDILERYGWDNFKTLVSSYLN